MAREILTYIPLVYPRLLLNLLFSSHGKSIEVFLNRGLLSTPSSVHAFSLTGSSKNQTA